MKYLKKLFVALERKFINLDAVLIRDVTLPQTLQDAIEKKKVKTRTRSFRV